MPIISKVGKKSLSHRLLVLSIFALLITGSATMIYPFLLMIAGTTKSAVDTPDATIVPQFLVDDTALYQKHLEGFFNEYLDQCRFTYDSELTAFRNAKLPEAVNEAYAAEWRGFLEKANLPEHAFMISYLQCFNSRKVIPQHLREFKRIQMRRFDGSIDRMNAELEVDFPKWNSFAIYADNYLMRRSKPGDRPFHEEYRKFKMSLPLEERYYFGVEGFYKNGLLKAQYTKDIAKYNKEHGTAYASYADIHLGRRAPAGPGRTERERADWELFVRTIISLYWIRADDDASPAFQDFMKAKYDDIKSLNKIYGTAHAAFDQIRIPAEAPASGIMMADWDAFLQGWRDPETGKMHMLPLENIRIHSVDFLFRDFLKERHGDVATANAALGTSAKDWIDLLPPQRDLHYLDFKKRTTELRREFVVRNYLTVIDYLVLHGRAVVNTALYCLLAILSALIVNPLAAYALSRFRPPSTYKMLLFLMLTMAFPPMVTQIPVFLMMRDLGLLNSFAALILPGLANGYSIFLLKGFFDSLPKELYESASIDGASEITIFWQITMNLSKPILAVIALGAFTGAYGNFMFALLICQDERMWTLMPWLYQLQLGSCQGVIFASLILAAIPTFIIFSLCQNVIMRGIVVPSEK